MLASTLLPTFLPWHLRYRLHCSFCNLYLSPECHPQPNMSWVSPATERLCHSNPCPWVLLLTEPLLVFLLPHLKRTCLCLLGVSSQQSMSLSPRCPLQKKGHLLVVILRKDLSPNSTWPWISVYMLCSCWVFFLFTDRYWILFIHD